MGFLDGFTLTRSPQKKENGLQQTPLAVADRIRRTLGIRELETMPAQAARAFQLASDSNSTAADFIKVIETDEALSARVIRIANSVYYFRGTPANDIEKAVGNIGLDELRCLLSASLLRSLLHGMGAAREQIWANSVATGVCARLLSRYCEKIGAGEAFLCGLVHDVGKLVMIRRDGRMYGKAIDLLASGQRTTLEAEERIFELNHVEVGKWVAEKWRFPASTVNAIAQHHQPWPATPVGRKNMTLGLLIKAADTIAHAAGIGHPSHLRAFTRSFVDQLPQAFSQFSLSTEEGQRFIETFKQQFENEFGLYQLENH